MCGVPLFQFLQNMKLLYVVYFRCKCPAHAHPGNTYGMSNILDLRSHANVTAGTKPSKDYAFEVRKTRL